MDNVNVQSKTAIMLLVAGIAIMPFVVAFPVLTHAETGQGDDVFRVIMTIFGVDRSRGDVVAIVTVNLF